MNKSVNIAFHGSSSHLIFVQDTAHVDIRYSLISRGSSPSFSQSARDQTESAAPWAWFHQTQWRRRDTGARNNGTLWQYPHLFRYTQIPSQCSLGKFIVGPNITRVINHPPIKTRHKTLRVIRTVVSIVAVCQI